jgi:hypothetical protein
VAQAVALRAAAAQAVALRAAAAQAAARALPWEAAVAT